jgi:hypothetical protein
LYGWKLFAFKPNGFAAMRKVFIPRNIVMFTFMAVYHLVMQDSGNILGLICDVVYINKNRKSNHGDEWRELSEGKTKIYTVSCEDRWSLLRGE